MCCLDKSRGLQLRPECSGFPELAQVFRRIPKGHLPRPEQSRWCLHGADCTNRDKKNRTVRARARQSQTAMMGTTEILGARQVPCAQLNTKDSSHRLQHNGHKSQTCAKFCRWLTPIHK